MKEKKISMELCLNFTTKIKKPVTYMIDYFNP